MQIGSRLLFSLRLLVCLQAETFQGFLHLAVVQEMLFGFIVKEKAEDVVCGHEERPEHLEEFQEPAPGHRVGVGPVVFHVRDGFRQVLERFRDTVGDVLVSACEFLRLFITGVL